MTHLISVFSVYTKLETLSQKKIPSLIQLQALAYACNVSLENILDAYSEGYYATNLLDTINRTYNVGINHTFDETFSFGELNTFINRYSIVLNAFYDEDQYPLCYIYFEENSIPPFYVYRYEMVNDRTYILTLDKGKNIQINKEDILHLEASVPHKNYYYEFFGKYIYYGKTLHFSLTFSLFMS